MNASLQTLGLVPFFTQQLADADLIQDRLGRVIQVQRSKITVACGSGEHLVELSASLRHLAAIDRPTVGDWVILDESLSRVDEVLQRKSLFKRLAAGESHERQAIAADIDTLFIVTSCNEEFKESRLERYLALCNEAGAMPVIVLTKADLVDNADTYIQRAQKTQSGVPVEAINALDATSINRLRSWISSTTTIALVGSSGVGKSSILNTLSGDNIAHTGDIRDDDKKGRHTTTHRELHILPTGGMIIDVPGMRELKVADINESIDTVFDDIDALAARCRFADCKHESEPGCAVLQALEEGELDHRRFSNYKKLRRENELATASLAEKRARDRDFGKMVKEVKAIKQNKNRN